MGSCGAVFAVERDATDEAGLHGKVTAETAEGRIELTGYRLEEAGTPGTAVDMAEPGVTSATDCTSEPCSASEPGKAGACGLYSGMCEPKSAAKLKKYAQEDGLSLIKFWSVDTAYDGSVHRAENIIPGKERSCVTDGIASSAGTRTVSVTGYDVLGNRFSKVVEIE